MVLSAACTQAFSAILVECDSQHRKPMFMQTIWTGITE